MKERYQRKSKAVLERSCNAPYVFKRVSYYEWRIRNFKNKHYEAAIAMLECDVLTVDHWAIYSPTSEHLGRCSESHTRRIKIGHPGASGRRGMTERVYSRPPLPPPHRSPRYIRIHYTPGFNTNNKYPSPTLATFKIITNHTTRIEVSKLLSEIFDN